MLRKHIAADCQTVHNSEHLETRRSTSTAAETSQFSRIKEAYKLEKDLPFAPSTKEMENTGDGPVESSTKPVMGTLARP